MSKVLVAAAWVFHLPSEYVGDSHTRIVTVVESYIKEFPKFYFLQQALFVSAGILLSLSHSPAGRLDHHPAHLSHSPGSVAAGNM